MARDGLKHTFRRDNSTIDTEILEVGTRVSNVILTTEYGRDISVPECANIYAYTTRVPAASTAPASWFWPDDLPACAANRYYRPAARNGVVDNNIAGETNAREYVWARRNRVFPTFTDRTGVAAAASRPRPCRAQYSSNCRSRTRSPRPVCPARATRTIVTTPHQPHINIA